MLQHNLAFRIKLLRDSPTLQLSDLDSQVEKVRDLPYSSSRLLEAVRLLFGFTSWIVGLHMTPLDPLLDGVVAVCPRASSLSHSLSLFSFSTRHQINVCRSGDINAIIRPPPHPPAQLSYLYFTLIRPVCRTIGLTGSFPLRRPTSTNGFLMGPFRSGNLFRMVH